MKYQLTPKIAQFDEAGFVVVEGWALIYNTDTRTGEFINATYEYAAVGIGLPDHVCLDAPKPVNDGKAIVRAGEKWTYPADHRGKKIYSTETGAESVVTEIGDIPNNYTLLKPYSGFDTWNGEAWVLDENKRHQHYVAVATAQKKQLLKEVTTQIDYLQDAIDAEIATDEEKLKHSAWKKYRVLLNRIDVDAAPAIEWPEKPE
ncbi:MULTISPECIES: tail fiber assembly protein [unclassified Gilliamella]|uniref:tail fiber assembly protein n=1 Tax=unclassified Gilliamella TaxID=2685620 RepID=UPI00226A6768|nr:MULTISPECIES: tail fiber assembly protein [unclassified Gilliamella]MCX8574509.1 tail fiber assembly protein [Gilliamella sp. B3831]MCX8576740.1 tail fiber assembly protein [Gilliamella sp. B3815]MCX8589278.1 tail fiber assembly protein [Gilliamella sp. B3812]MCX8603852.1 tail fiber assembly protein [Gilliamella sp. B3823]MCX8606732.1 tail fiber assembly protein [Gilliamella sp. B3825]